MNNLHNNTNNSLVQQCLDILKKNDIKYELRAILSPVINLIIYELNPYIYVIIGIIVMTFLLNLTILILFILMYISKNTIM